MRKISYLFTSLFVFTLLLAGCNKTTETGSPTDKENKITQNTEDKDPVKSTSPEMENTSEMDDIAQADQKLAGYVDCINGYSNQILMAYDRYLSWADEANGPTGKEQNIYGVNKLYNDPKTCLDPLSKAASLKPSYPTLDKAGEAYAIALKKIDPLMIEANEYYEEKNYEDDAMAKGKEMHPKLLEAFKGFDTADLAMRNELEKIQDDLDTKRLAELEKAEGKKYAYLTTSTMVLAKKVLNQSNVIDLKEITLDSLQKAVETFEKSVDDLKAYDKAHKSELGLGVNIDSFITQAGNLVTASKELTRRVRDNKPFDTGETMLINAGTDWMVEGTPGKVLHVYNDLVNSSNLLRF